MSTRNIAGLIFKPFLKGEIVQKGEFKSGNKLVDMNVVWIENGKLAEQWSVTGKDKLRNGCGTRSNLH